MDGGRLSCLLTGFCWGKYHEESSGHSAERSGAKRNQRRDSGWLRLQTKGFNHSSPNPKHRRGGGHREGRFRLDHFVAVILDPKQNVGHK